MRLRGLTAQRDRASKPTVPSMRTSDAQEDQGKRSPDNVRQDECWFSHVMLPISRGRFWRTSGVPCGPDGSRSPDARAAGLKELIAEVLPENAAMRKVFSKFGFQHRRGPDPRVVHLMLTL